MKCETCGHEEPTKNDVGEFDLPTVGTIENILEYVSGAEGRSVVDCVGILECAKIQLLKNNDILEEPMRDDDDEGEEWKKEKA